MIRWLGLMDEHPASHDIYHNEHSLEIDHLLIH